RTNTQGGNLAVSACQSRKALRCLRRPEFLGLLIPAARDGNISEYVGSAKLFQFDRIVDWPQDQSSTGVTRFGGPFQCEASRRDVPGRNELLATLNKELDLPAIELPSWRLGRSGRTGSSPFNLQRTMIGNGAVGTAQINRKMHRAD